MELLCCELRHVANYSLEKIEEQIILQKCR